MSLRAKIVASIAFATSAFLLVPAAQAATHPVQVTGAKLKSALLPASAFGPGFKLGGATSTGKALLHRKARNHVPAMSCAKFEDGGLGLYGESAAAASISENQNADASSTDLEILYEQEVYQFPGAKAAATFYSQAHAKYAKCRSFSEKLDGGEGTGDDTLQITLQSISKIKVGKYQAFRLSESASVSSVPGFSLMLSTLVAVKGADVFIVINFSGTDNPVAAKTVLKLVNRVARLR